MGALRRVVVRATVVAAVGWVVGCGADVGTQAVGDGETGMPPSPTTTTAATSDSGAEATTVTTDGGESGDASTTGVDLPAPIDLLWVGAHPDDEGIPGPLLFHACRFMGQSCHFLVMTHGESGDCMLAGGCNPDVGTVRTQEMIAAAACYDTPLTFEEFPNGPANDQGPERTIDDVIAGWNDVADPVATIARHIRTLRPTRVVSFHEGNGFTGHIEHRTVGRLVPEAIAMAADATVDLDGLPAHVPIDLLRVLNIYPELLLIMGNDPHVQNFEFEGEQDCGDNLTCLAQNDACFANHASQAALFGFMMDVLNTLRRNRHFERIEY